MNASLHICTKNIKNYEIIQSIKQIATTCFIGCNIFFSFLEMFFIHYKCVHELYCYDLYCNSRFYCTYLRYEYFMDYCSLLPLKSM